MRNVAPLWAFVFTAFAFSAAPAHAQEPMQNTLFTDVPDTRVMQPHLTEARVVQLAMRFCRKIGEPLKGVPDSVRFFSVGELYYGPCWEVRYEHQDYFHIADENESIVFYSDERRTRLLERTPPGKAVAESVALRQAQTALQATGLLDNRAEFAGPYATEPSSFFREISLDHGKTYFPVASGHEWLVYYACKHNGIEYSDQQDVDMRFQAEDGRLNRLLARFKTPPPSDTTVRVSEEQVTAAAWEYIAGTTIQNAVFQSGQVELKIPKHFFTPEGKLRFGAQAEPVYRLFFRYEPRPELSHMVPWHDSSSSAGSSTDDSLLVAPTDPYNGIDGPVTLILTYSAGSLSKGKPAFWSEEASVPPRGLSPIRTTLDRLAIARAILIHTKSKRSFAGWNPSPAAVWSETQNPAQFHAVKTGKTLANPRMKIRAAKSPVVRETAKLQLRIFLKNVKVDTYETLLYMGDGRV